MARFSNSGAKLQFIARTSVHKSTKKGNKSPKLTIYRLMGNLRNILNLVVHGGAG